MAPAAPPSNPTWLGLSPLRYPGAKRRLVDRIAPLIGHREELVEPFAGGASVSLALLHRGQVDRAVLGDADPDVHAFWSAAAYDTDWLAHNFLAAEVTIEAFLAWRASAPTSIRDRALRFLLLNRTSFSGIVHPRSGPIGGLGQTGAYRLDARLARERVATQLRHVGTLARAGLLVVLDGGWQDVAATTSGMLYLDPPYVAASDRLYATSFTASDHLELADWLHETTRPWVLSYDDHPMIRDLYSDAATIAPEHSYSARGSRTTATTGRELIITDAPTALEQSEIA